MKTTERPTLRGDVLDYARERYGTVPEYLWRPAPRYCVLRRADSRKWYGLIMDIPAERLGLPGKGTADILELKADPLLSGSLRAEKGISAGYHMKRGGWISVLLDGTVEKQTIFRLLDMSFGLAAAGRSSSRSGGHITDWLVPANPRYYDIEAALAETPDGTFLWKQSSRIAAGDTVYLYVAAPVSAIRYRCRALETDIPCCYADENVRMSRAMRLQLLQRYPEESFGLPLLRAHGVPSVRGPRGIPNGLLRLLEKAARG